MEQNYMSVRGKNKHEKKKLNRVHLNFMYKDVPGVYGQLYGFFVHLGNTNSETSSLPNLRSYGNLPF